MSRRIHSRPRIPHRKRRTKSSHRVSRCCRCSRCAICGSRENVQLHHLGGRKHALHFTIPLCAKHHDALTFALRVVEMRATSDREERLRRARLAGLVFLWFIDEAVKGNPTK
jgi:hypothetical protein